MTKKLVGLFASVALMGSGMALAHNDDKKGTQTQTQSGTGGAGNQDMGQSGSVQGSDIGGSGTQTGSGSQQGQQTQVGQTGVTDQLSGNQLTGRVVKSDRKMVWVEHAGAIVPLKIDKNTQFTDPSLKRVTDIKEGDQIRASFEVRKTDNVATSIQMSTGAGMGGSGSDVLMPDQGINQPADSLPPAPGTGGSGSEPQEGDINEGLSPDSSLDSGDVNSDQNRRIGGR